MSSESHNPSSTNLLGSFVGFLSVLGIFLYFIGWIYRWAYFGFFEVEIITLDLPIQSFLLLSIQVILGNHWAFIRCIFVIFITTFLIKLTLWLIRSPNTDTSSSTKRFLKKEWIKNLHNFWLFQPLRYFAQLLPLPFRHEAVIVIWILVALFWLACWQGTTDAFRDAVNETSTRPIITLVSPSDKLTLGRNLDDLLTNPSLKGSRIIGDVEQFKQILGRETNDTTDPKQPIIWRLLIENRNWVYLFPAMPSGAKANQRPPVLVINASDGGVRLLILSRPKLG
ncbi:hypothetical protein [Iningainema tapete]|uniref:Uncharacterized protein n=1 Tax=Iningainema tapete BLCC-T55 TaxID=2748662 RepID=A0A8J6XNC9_9CYAN|nr:hypothetical protein [Iningainema tapete]MBD2775105.1 hypothetical protein [Iningainema tapete BLCC-T55]